MLLAESTACGANRGQNQRELQTKEKWRGGEGGRKERFWNQTSIFALHELIVKTDRCYVLKGLQLGELLCSALLLSKTSRDT